MKKIILINFNFLFFFNCKLEDEGDFWRFFKIYLGSLILNILYNKISQSD
jgi:hypothetical protein